MITKAIKAEEIASLSEKFGRSKAAFLVDFKGMTVEQVTSLRKKLVPVEAEMKVVRNTLAVRALMDHPKSESLKDSFVGNNAIIFAYSDASASAIWETTARARRHRSGCAAGCNCARSSWPRWTRNR